MKNHVVVVHRGTADARDVANDALHVAGYKGDCFYHNRSIPKKAEKKYESQKEYIRPFIRQSHSLRRREELKVNHQL